MPMVTESLTAGTWHELTNLDDESIGQFFLDTSDVVIAAIEAGTPDSLSPGFLCANGTINNFVIFPGKSLWLLLDSGTADVTYSQFGGIEIDLEKCAYARSDTITIDETVTNVFPIVGFDDSAADPITYVGLLHTFAARIAAAATIDSATMTLIFAKFKAGRTIRIYGIEAADSITSGLSTYETLAVDPTLTTAYVDVTIDSSGQATIDLTAIVQELVDDVTGWDTASPVQLWIGDIGAVPTSGLDESHIITSAGRTGAIFVRSS